MFYGRKNEIENNITKKDEVLNMEKEGFRLQNNTCHVFEYSQMAQNCLLNDENCFGLFINFIEERHHQNK